jgi:hypothetical protein
VQNTDSGYFILRQTHIKKIFGLTTITYKNSGESCSSIWLFTRLGITFGHFPAAHAAMKPLAAGPMAPAGLQRAQTQ